MSDLLKEMLEFVAGCLEKKWQEWTPPKGEGFDNWAKAHMGGILKEAFDEQKNDRLKGVLFRYENQGTRKPSLNTKKFFGSETAPDMYFYNESMEPLVAIELDHGGIQKEKGGRVNDNDNPGSRLKNALGKAAANRFAGWPLTISVFVDESRKSLLKDPIVGAINGQDEASKKAVCTFRDRFQCYLVVGFVSQDAKTIEFQRVLWSES